ncbi:hypothetical protein [Bacillus sp. UMB0893]|nr:hypothetical protein [Bacillus sp. UMB0893]
MAEGNADSIWKANRFTPGYCVRMLRNSAASLLPDRSLFPVVTASED